MNIIAIFAVWIGPWKHVSWVVVVIWDYQHLLHFYISVLLVDKQCVLIYFLSFIRRNINEGVPRKNFFVQSFDLILFLFTDSKTPTIDHLGSLFARMVQADDPIIVNDFNTFPNWSIVCSFFSRWYIFILDEENIRPLILIYLCLSWLLCLHPLNFNFDFWLLIDFVCLLKVI